jgi:16S rRNA (cytosine1402-N4)-methyltransferase
MAIKTQLDKTRDPEPIGRRCSRGTPLGTHVPVLVKEVMRCLRPGCGEVVADCTVGYGGHAMEFLKLIGPSGRLVGLDVDGAELRSAERRLAPIGVPLALRRSNFARLEEVMAKEKIEGFDIIFADLGVSSMQVDDPRRGVSYRHDGPLDMRMDDRRERTGADLLASMPQEELSQAMDELADEEDHAKIAEWIVRQRQVCPITTTGELVRLVLNAKGYSPRARRRPWEVPGGLHPAAKTFQALRILVNDELTSLTELLGQAPRCLCKGGRIGIISFHSGEDRLVKNAFRDGLRRGVYRGICPRVITPSAREARDNPRSSSAKFRWARAP